MASDEGDVNISMEDEMSNGEILSEEQSDVIDEKNKRSDDEEAQEGEKSEELITNHTEEEEQGKEEKQPEDQEKIEDKEKEPKQFYAKESATFQNTEEEENEEERQKKRPIEDSDDGAPVEKKSKVEVEEKEGDIEKKEDENTDRSEEKVDNTNDNDSEKEKSDSVSMDVNKESDVEITNSEKDLSNISSSPKVNGVSDSPDSKQDDDEVTVKSEDSEKENRNKEIELPMDLSTKSGSSNGNGPDVIMLSDSEEEPMNGMVNGDFKELTKEEHKFRKNFIKQLQAELRNEEAKLVLLKRLRQSQLTTHPVQENVTKPPKHHTQPPPLVRAGQQQNQARPAHSQPPQLLRNTPAPPNRHQQGPPPLVLKGQNMSNRNSLEHQMRFQNMAGANSSSHYRQGPNSNSQSQQSSANSHQAVDNQTPAQRQAAAKMALRKQLEKTLLQIPPPKPPPPEMNFVPSLASPDFIYLLGLEEAVNYIIDANLISKGQKNPDEKMVCNPFTCVQCGTDFTPVWKREKAGSKNVICEHCVTTNQKKALKQEHTNRLKSAFVKALQQEQEIERMQAQEKSAQNSSSNNSSASAGSVSSPMTLPSSVGSYKANSDALRQHQNFLQAHQTVAAHQTALRMGQPLGLTPFGARGTFPYQIPFGAKPQDLNQLQRQYLLDMIPNRGGAMSWKP